MPYEFALRGTNTGYAATDADGNVATAASDNFPTEIAEPDVLNDWLVFDALGLSPDLENKAEQFTAANGDLHKGSKPYWKFEMRTLRMLATDFDSFNKLLQQHCSRNYIYFAALTYDVTDIHGADECIRVVCDVAPAHEYDDGTKDVTITMYKSKMTEVLG